MGETSNTQQTSAGKTTEQLLQQGYTVLGQGKTSEAILLFDEAVAQSPTSAAALYSLALARFSNGEYTTSQDLAARAQQMDPQNAACEMLLGANFRELEDFEASEIHFRRAADLNPQEFQAWRELGTLYTILGKPDKAAESLSTALKLDPTDIDATVDLGHLLHMLGRSADAVTTLRKASEMRPGDAAILQSLGEVYSALGDKQAAAEAFSSVLRVQPNNVIAQVGLGWLYLDLGRAAEAEGSFLRARQIDREHDLYAQHGVIWSRVQQANWRGALDVTIETLKLDRFSLTTDLLKFLTDQFFGESSDAAPRQAELESRLRQEHKEHLVQHSEMPD